MVPQTFRSVTFSLKAAVNQQLLSLSLLKSFIFIYGLQNVRMAVEHRLNVNSVRAGICPKNFSHSVFRRNISVGPN